VPPYRTAEYYADLRNSQEVKALPVTVRSLETIIRLSCAHAKVGARGGAAERVAVEMLSGYLSRNILNAGGCNCTTVRTLAKYQHRA
jgi:hypothetical protein